MAFQIAYRGLARSSAASQAPCGLSGFFSHITTLRDYSSSDTGEGKIGADDGEVAELLDASIVRGPQRKEDAAGRPRILTTRREALALYREVLRYSNLFVWRDERGRVWRDVIRASARQEYEAARHEADPELVNRMLVTGRDAVHRTVEQFMRKRRQIIAEEEAAGGGGGIGGSGVGGIGGGGPLRSGNG
jgi:hypothetical protein